MILVGRENIRSDIELKPKLSVVIPTYNRANQLPRAIRSVLSQTFEDFELIIVDDGSTDDTQEILRQFQDSRVRCLWQENRGRSAARNAGAFVARGQFVTFLDSDDEALPEWLAGFANEFTSNRIGVVCVGIKIAGLDGKDEGELLPKNRGPLYENQTGLFLSGTFALRHDIFQKLGGYTESLTHSENTDLALRLVSHCFCEGYETASIPKALAVYHREPLRWARSREHFTLRLETARYFLSTHGARYLEKHRRGYANHCAIAGVNAARLGLSSEARRFFASAIRANPSNWRHYSRLALAIASPLGERFWLRFDDEARSDLQNF